MSVELSTLRDAFAEPFACEAIHFLPLSKRQHAGQWEALAQPYANYCAYEERLNRLVFGRWSTPYAPPLVLGLHLLMPAQVEIAGITHIGYAQARFDPDRPENEQEGLVFAYAQAFWRACARFGLGSYLRTLPRLWLPCEQEASTFQMPQAVRLAWVEKLYLEAGIPVRSPSSETPPTLMAAASPQGQNASEIPAPSAHPLSSQTGGSPPSPQRPPVSKMSPPPTFTSSPSALTLTHKGQRNSVPATLPRVSSSQATQVPSAPLRSTGAPARGRVPSAGKKQTVDAALLAYLQKSLTPQQARSSCRYYRVNDLAELTPEQALDLSDFLNKKRQPAG